MEPTQHQKNTLLFLLKRIILYNAAPVLLGTDINRKTIICTSIKEIKDTVNKVYESNSNFFANSVISDIRIYSDSDACLYLFYTSESKGEGSIIISLMGIIIFPSGEEKVLNHKLQQVELKDMINKLNTIIFT